MNLTATQVTQLRATGNLITTPGDRLTTAHSRCGDVCECPIVEPAEWAALVGATCDTCKGDYEWFENWPGPNDYGRIKKRCPAGCVNGLQRIELRGLDPAYYSPPNFNTVLVARATVKAVLPVEWRNQEPAIHMPDGTWHSFSGGPSPGVDFGVLLDNVEWA